MTQLASVRKETRELPMLTLRAAFEPSTFDEKNRTVELVWTTGAKGLRRSYWDGDYYEELEVSEAAVRLGRLNNGAPLLAAHEAWSLDAVIGVVDRAWLKDGEGRALVRFSEREEVQGIVRDVQSGILRNISVGYTVYRYEVTKEADSKIDTYRAVDWEPMELSIVPIGFDDGAKVRAGDKKKNNKVEILFRGDAATENKNKNEVRAMDEEQQKAAAEARAQAVKEAAEAATRAERARVTEIRSSVQKAGLGAELADKLVTDGVAIDAARIAIIDAMAEKQKGEQPDTRGQHVEAGDDQIDKWKRGALSALIVRGAKQSLFKDEKFEPGEFRGMKLLDLARDYLEMVGVKTRGMSQLDLAGRALTFRSGYNGTSDFSVLLENVTNKTLLGSFNTAPNIWRLICAIGSVSDFRQQNRYRKGSFGTLDKILENGEFKQKQIPDGAKEKISIGTKGNIIGVTRQLIINDDLGFLLGLASDFGLSAGRSIESDFFAALAANSNRGPTLNDGNPVFFNRTATGTNIGTGAALSADSLDADKLLLRKQKDISGNDYLEIYPSILLVPVDLETKAKQYNNAEYDLDVTSKFQVPNKVRGIVNQVVSSPRLSGTRRWMFADPSVAPVIEVAFLDGQQTPFLDSQEGWRVDGIEWKVRLDYGVGGVGYQGAIVNDGA